MRRLSEREERIAARLVQGFGLVERTLRECAERLDGHRIGARSTLRISDITGDAERALEFLSHLTFPATRHVLVPLAGWTAFVNNGKNGSEFADYAIHLGPYLAARAARIVDAPSQVWTNGSEREVLSYEAHILQLYGPEGELLRGVSCIDDGGRWSFHTEGSPHPVEASFDYATPRKRKRFPSSALRQLAAAFGLPWLDAERLVDAPEYLLMQEVYASEAWSRRIEESACTFEEANDPAHGYFERGLGWVPHMETHAESVVRDFERAVRLNPAYEPRVREHLAAARRVLARPNR